MRGVKIFAGRSHPLLADAICERLGTTTAKCEVGNFSNGETSVNIGTSVRNQDVFIVQSGSPRINDSVMELLIMIAACKGGSARTITAVMPYFPYSRQSKKKSHRGCITARMLANLMSVAGVDHVITVDLHASQMQGFFGKPVDNLFAEPLIARWIMRNVPGWREAVVVSKNAGGTKRVTSLADALKLNFALVSTDKLRRHADTDPVPKVPPRDNLVTPRVEPGARRPSEYESAEGYTDERARDVVTARLVQGHLVDDDYPDDMTASMVSTASRYDEAAESEEDTELEHTITLVGHVKDKIAFLMDDMIDKSATWIAAAETVVKKGGAKKVYCIATHGLLGDNSLEEMEACSSIDYVVITNSFPITAQRLKTSKKLVVLDLATLLSEAIRRNHHGGE